MTHGPGLPQPDALTAADCETDKGCWLQKNLGLWEEENLPEKLHS